MRCRLPSFRQLAKKQEEAEEEVEGKGRRDRALSKACPAWMASPVLTRDLQAVFPSGLNPPHIHQLHPVKSPPRKAEVLLWESQEAAALFWVRGGPLTLPPRGSWGCWGSLKSQQSFYLAPQLSTHKQTTIKL